MLRERVSSLERAKRHHHFVYYHLSVQLQWKQCGLIEVLALTEIISGNYFKLCTPFKAILFASSSLLRKGTVNYGWWLQNIVCSSGFLLIIFLSLICYSLPQRYPSLHRYTSSWLCIISILVGSYIVWSNVSPASILNSLVFFMSLLPVLYQWENQPPSLIVLCLV